MPKLRGGPRYTEIITFRVRPEIKEKIANLAEKERQTVTDKLRKFLEDTLSGR